MIGIVPYLVLLFILLFGSLWVAAAMGLVGFLGTFSVIGLLRTLLVTGTQAWNVNTSFTLLAVPLFIFMGEILFHGGFIDVIYTRVSKLVTGLPGGLLHSNILACAIFAACSGSSLASAATIGSVGYPIQQQRGYNKALSLGSIAAGGTLGILIPPSIIMIIYGVMAEQSIGRLFLGGVIPGLILAGLFSLYILLVCFWKPSYAPAAIEKATWKQRLGSLAGLWQIGLLVVVVLGGIYGGVATPTEVAALGATMAIILVASSRKLSWKVFKESLIATVVTNAMIMFIVVGALLLSQALFYYNVPPNLGRLVSASGLSPIGILVIVTIMYIILGMFFDGISMMVLTLPFIAPILNLAGFDLVWFGIYLTILIEIGLITPPVGLNLYVLQGSTREPLGLVVRGSVPFYVPMLIVLTLLVIFPQLAVWLPSLML